MSQQDSENSVLCAISQLLVLLFDAIRTEINAKNSLKELQTQVEREELGSVWTVQEGLILYKRCIYLMPTSPLIPSILSVVHNSTH